MVAPGRPPRLLRTVEVPRRLLGLLVGALATCLLLLVFAIGRESGRRAERAQPRERSAAELPQSLTEPAPPPPARPRPHLEPDPRPPPLANPGEYRPPIAAPTPPTPPAEPASVPAADPSRAAVARYFAELADVEAQVNYRGDPQELAMSLLGQTAGGDTSGFDDLIASQKAAQHSIRAISAPQPCAEHHRRTLTLLGESMTMLEQVRRGVVSQDLLGLTAVVEQARDLESQARQLEALGQELKRRYAVH